MTPEEKVALLKEAGVWDVIGYPGCIDKLIDLVAKHERNRHAWTQEHWTEYEHAIAAAAAAAAREAKPKKPEECAKGCPPLQVCDYCQKAEQAEQEPVLWGDGKFAPHERPQKREPVAWRCTRNDISDINYADDDESLKYFECRNYDIEPLYAAPQPVKQEPVAWYSDKGGFNECGEGKPLYAAPVRTKDLTDDEIDEIFAEHGTIPNTKAVRSVIAADREKNK